MIRKSENKSTQLMQCDLLADKRICKPQSPRPEGKKNLLGQSPLSWGSNSTASCAGEEIPGSQPMPSFQPQCLLLGCTCPFSANELQLPFPTSIKKQTSHSFYVIGLLVLEKGLRALFPLKNVPLRVARTNLFFAYSRCYSEISNKSV